MSRQLSPPTRELLAHWPAEWSSMTTTKILAFQRTGATLASIDRRVVTLRKRGLIESTLDERNAHITRRSPEASESPR